MIKQTLRQRSLFGNLKKDLCFKTKIIEYEKVCLNCIDKTIMTVEDRKFCFMPNKVAFPSQQLKKKRI